LKHTTRRIGFITAAVAAICFSAIPAAAKFTKGPYIQNGRTDGVTICWESDKSQAATVIVTKSGATAASVAAPGDSDFHKIKIGSLAPGTTYDYSVREADGSEAAGSFRTFPAKQEPFRFAAYGDTRSLHYLHRALIKWIIKFKPAFLLNSGDLVEDGTKPDQWGAFWDIVEPFARDAYYYPVLGNHERDSEIYFKYFDLPDNGKDGRYYSFTYSNVLVVGLDYDELLSGDQKNWLIKQLKASDADFKIVVFHIPLYSSGKRPPNVFLRKIYVPIFKKYGVQLVLNGHDHFYERSVDSNGIQYVVTGGGGAPLYDFVRKIPESVVRVKVNHFMIFDVSGKRMDAKAIDIDGKVIDTFTITAK